ncbi:MAG: glycosyltransferase [Planctomycetes bacterium]|nr:glycosyltransferase [Planctomycetota bacterium]
MLRKDLDLWEQPGLGLHKSLADAESTPTARFGSPAAVNSMRILQVSHELPPHEIAGTAIYTLNIARAQAQRHEVFVFSRLQDAKLKPWHTYTENRDGLTIRYMNRADLDWVPFDRSYRDPKGAAIFRNWVAEVRPDIIHFQHVVGLGIEVLDVPRELGIPAVYTLHDFWPMCPMGQRMCYTDGVICDPIDFSKCGRCVYGDGWQDLSVRDDMKSQPGKAPSETPSLRERWANHFVARMNETPGRFARRPRAALNAMRRTLAGMSSSPSLPISAANPFEIRSDVLREKLLEMDLLITPSAFLRDQFMQHWRIPSTQIIHSANGMDFSYVKALPKTPSPNLRFGFMGSIIRTKGVEVLVDAFLDAAADHQDIELLVFGAPNRWSVDYLEGLKSKAAAHGAAGRVHFKGRFNNRDVSEVLAQMDVLVVPSIWFENAPLTLNEAAMTSTPILVSDRGGMLEFAVANNYGRTFELGNSKSLAALMRELATDRSKLAALVGTQPPIKAVRDNAEELVGIYKAILHKRYAAPSLELQHSSRGGCLPA